MIQLQIFLDKTYKSLKLKKLKMKLNQSFQKHTEAFFLIIKIFINIISTITFKILEKYVFKNNFFFMVNFYSPILAPSSVNLAAINL